MSKEPVEIDFFDVIKIMDNHIKRAGLTREQARSLCYERYGTRTRFRLSDKQLIDFWSYLETLPSRKESRFKIGIPKLSYSRYSLFENKGMFTK